MLYQEFTITSHLAAVGHIADFASALGWTVTDDVPITGYTSGKILVAPSSVKRPSPKQWLIGDYGSPITLSGVLAWCDLTMSGADAIDAQAKMLMLAPFDATCTLRLEPTKVSIFGGTAPEPWIAAVFTYEYNLYRHLYLGHVEPIGGFTGGELLSACQPRDGVSDIFAFWNYTDPLHSYLFNARAKGSSDRLGGLHVEHANAASEWNKFWAPTGFSRDDTHIPGIACGGFTDGFNDGYAIRARSPYAGTVILVPQNLYITDNANGFVPVGRAAGVRLVDMIDLAPEQTVDVGGVYYHVFPAWSRSTNPVHDLRGFNRRESSFYIGYAYMEDPA